MIVGVSKKGRICWEKREQRGTSIASPSLVLDFPLGDNLAPLGERGRN